MARCKFILILTVFVGISGMAVFAATQTLMSIQIKRGEIRGAPSFLGKIVARLSYGDRVEKLSRQGDWMRVSLPGHSKQGWIHESALTAKKIVLTPGEADVQQAATSDEIALAGKGFNQQVENEFKAQHPGIDYTWIDKMEQMVVSQDEMMAFLETGGLLSQGGVQ